MSNQLQPLPGALIRDFKKCGRLGCKCAQGDLHGPYFVRVWYEQGKRRKAYVKAPDAPRVEAAIQLFEIERNIGVLRASMARRIGARQRALLASFVAEREREAEELRTTSARQGTTTDKPK